MNSYPHHRKAADPRPPRSGAWVFLFIAAFAILAVAAAFSPFGETVGKQMLAPAAEWVRAKLGRNEAVTQTMAQTSALPTDAPTEEPVKTETVTVTAEPFYILQMGLYEEESDAIIVSAQNQSMGGAGYVFASPDGFRLFAAAYTDADSLKRVQQQIRSDGFVNEAYITDAKTVRITLKGAPEAIEIYERAVNALQTPPKELSDLAIAFDQKSIGLDALCDRLTVLNDAVKNALKELEKLTPEDVAPIRNTLSQYEKAISTFLTSRDTIIETMLSGAIRHLQLSVIDAYISFFEG